MRRPGGQAMTLGIPSVRTAFGAASILAFGLSLLLALSYAPPARPQAPLPKVDDLITGGIPNITSVEIAPMTTAGEQTAGNWTGVPNGPFSGMLARSGIIPGVTDPTTMHDRAGQIDTITDSGVVNEGGSRVTLGYYVKTKGLSGDFSVENNVFVLMSYDYVLVDGKASIAFEVFIFQLPGSTLYRPQADGLAPLQYGVAVNGDGRTLSEVPLSIAQVRNYKGGKVPEDTAVRPGVEVQGFGCLECHARTDEFTGRTGGFPWREKVLDQPRCAPPKPEKPADDRHGSLGPRALLEGLLCGVGVTIPGPARPSREDDEEDPDGGDHGGPG